MMKKYLILLFITFCFISCENYTQDEYKEHYVVEGLLLAGKELPQIKLSTTVSMDERYIYSRESTIQNADVQVHLLSDNGKIEQIYSYTNENSRYLPIDKHEVRHGKVYKLHVTIPGYSKEITAETKVPEKVKIASQSADTLRYMTGEAFQLHLQKHGDEKRILKFFINIRSKDYKKENLTPVFKEIVEDRDEYYYDRLVMHLWDMFTENSFKKNEQGYLVITYPWTEFPFYENNSIIITSIDDNFFDFSRSQIIQQSNGDSSPGEIHNVITHIDGALGIFGSMSADTTSVYLKRK